MHGFLDFLFEAIVQVVVHLLDQLVIVEFVQVEIVFFTHGSTLSKKEL